MPDSGSQGGQIKSARPSFAVAGQNDDGLVGGLLEMLITETWDGLYRCEARFGNWGPKDNAVNYLYFDRQKLEFGKQWQVKIGDDVIFDGKIFGLEGSFPDSKPPEIVVLADDALQDLRMTRRTRTFADASDSDVFNSIAGDHSLTPSLDLTGSSHKILAQVNQSDLAFLRERARAIGAEVWVDGTTLYAKPRPSRTSGSSLQLGYRHELREFTVTADLATQRTSVTASGWDVSGKQAITHEAKDDVISSELGQDASGASVLQQAFGERKESIAHGVPLTSDDAQARSEAYFKQMARRFLVGSGVAETTKDLRVGRQVELIELGTLFNGKYVLTEVRHRFDAEGGLRTEFTAERAGIGQ